MHFLFFVIFGESIKWSYLFVTPSLSIIWILMKILIHKYAYITPKNHKLKNKFK